ncbi:MAG: alpha/beta fold hydrolase [Chloroflexi bacterium]|nr:alpha/beta fold hydrolase [Chloroflexota bacterium]
MLPAPIRATPADLPRPVAEALAEADPRGGEIATCEAAGIPFASIAWGEPDGRPLLLIHGVTASARIWWRVGPALAATGRRVTALDLPGHGLTGHWQGHHRFRDNARDVAAWIRAMDLDLPELQVVGHSWGAMTAAALPAAGIRPATIVLVDPPSMPLAFISAMATDPAERPLEDMAASVAALAAANPRWSSADIMAKAEALQQLDLEAARAVLLDNGDWDGGLADLADPAAAGIPIWIVRGEERTGGLLPDSRLAAFAGRIGWDHILTIADGPHAPQRLYPEATTAALLRALA